MKVAHVITRLIIGGAQENTLLTVEGQHHRHKDEVTLITGPGVGPEGSLEERARAGGLNLRIIPDMRRNIHPLRDIASYRNLFAMLRELKPDVIHTHSSKAGILGRAAAAKLRIPVVHTIHGAAFHYGQNPILHRSYIAAEKWAASRTDKFISVCDAMTDQYVAAGIAPRDKFVTIYSGMEVEPFLNPPRSRADVRTELGFQPDDVVFGKVARLFHLKGHEFVIEAAKRVCADNPHVRFLFVGDGILREKYVAEIARGGLADRFVFTGLVPPSRIPELIHACDAVVHTSLWEGLARVLPQGLISGKPVVSFDVDGAREVVIPDETGFLIPPQSVEQLADALTALARDSVLRSRLGETGRAKFTDRFRHENMTSRIREVYAEVMR
ncbi:MAG: glycosyltransferase family 4 protein [Planctomycetaceae bacterium]